MAGSVDMPEIIVTRGGTVVAQRSLDRSGIRLGRDADNDLVLDDPTVTARHAVIVQEAGAWWIRSPADERGLRVAGRACQSHALADGDRIGIGAFELCFAAPERADLDLDRTRVFDPSDSLDLHQDDAAVGSVQVPGYEIIRETGRGGMGRVFEAVQISTERTVALKIMLEGPFTDAKTKRRFEREVHIVASLRHPNIAQIYESGLHEGRYWFAMEFVDGQPLDAPEVVSRLGPRDRLVLMATVCEAVGHAHDRMVVHRDLKPSNILICKDGLPHILDFGLAKVQDARRDPEMMLSLAGELMGTPAYMSPEQTEGDPTKVDARADVYALGVIFYQLLTGQFPYDVRGRLDQVIHRIATTDPTRPSQISREINSELEAILLKAIAKDPDERYPSAKAMGQDLRRMLAGEPIQAKLASRSYVLTKALARNRPLLIGAVALAGAVVASVLVTRAWLVPLPKAPRTDQRAATAIAEAPPPAGTAVTEARLAEPPAVGSQPAATSRAIGEPGGAASRPAASRPAVVASPATAPAAPRPQSTAPTPRLAVTSSPATTPADTMSTDTMSTDTMSTDTMSTDTMSTETKERHAQRWLDRLSSLMDRGDYLRAHLALERLNTRYSDVAAVARSGEKLKRWSDRIEAELGPGSLRDGKDFVLHSPPSDTADWRAAMTIAQQVVAANSDAGIVVLRILLESEAAGTRFQVIGRGVGFYGGKDVTIQRDAMNGDILFIGPSGQASPSPGIEIKSAHHRPARIEVNPARGRTSRFGDVIVRQAVP